MFVREVVLENVKSFETATISIGHGLTAIVGPNGAGKSTILEAIGYGLFGYMPHRPQVNFMRHGSTQATVAVEFTSPRDGRPYRVERTMRRSRARSTGMLAANATTTVSLFDIDLARSIDQPAADLEDWLTQQLGVDGLSSPAEVFEHVVGVPQGRLTADFLDSTRLRKERFDPILRTAEFQQAVDRLRPLTQYYHDRAQVLKATAANLEGRLAGESQIQARLSDAQSALAQTRLIHAQAIAELGAAKATLKTYGAYRDLLEDAERTLVAATEREDQAVGVFDRAEVTVREAHSAAQILETLRGAYVSHQAAEKHIGTLAGVERQAQELERDRDRQALTLEGTRNDLSEAQDLVGPTVLSLYTKGSETHELSYGEVRDKFRDVVAVAEQEAAAARTSLQQAGEDVLTFQVDAEQEYALAVTGCEDQQKEFNRFQQQALVAAQLEDRRSILDQLRNEQAMLHAWLESDRYARDLLTATGSCPFFENSCRNLADVPDVVVTFGLRAQRHQAQLASVQTSISDATSAFDEAIAAEAEIAGMQVVSARIADFENTMVTAEATATAAKELATAIEASDIEKLATIADLVENIAVSEGHSVGLSRIAKRALRALTVLATPVDGRTIEIGTALLSIATRRAETARVELDTIDAKLASLSADREALSVARSTFDATTSAHAEYLRNENLAGLLDARRADVEDARQTVLGAKAAAAMAQGAVNEARTQFDPVALDAASKARDTALGRSEQLSERVVRIEADVKRLSADLHDLWQVRAELGSTRIEITRLMRFEDRSEFIRTILRDAGPYVTEAVLAGVSDTADEIYSDIIGSRSGRLRWAADYDIVLGQEGFERHFAQLSGGEQMSAALAVRLALLRDLLNMDVAFFDEPTQHLDAERRENLAQQILAVRGFSQLVVISHDDTFERHIDNVIRVTNINGTSTVDYG